VANFLYMRSGQTTELLVSEIFTFFNELINCVNQCKNIIQIECEEIQKLFQWMNLIRSKRAADKISLEDEKQILLDVQISYDKVNKLLNK
jgi:hypothetical protein